MKLSYAEYLKRENSIKALLHLLDVLNVIKQKQTRFGPIRYLSEGEMQLFVQRMYKDKA